MKKTEQLHMGEIDQCRDDGCHVDNRPKVLSDLGHLGSMEEPKSEREQVAQLVQVHRIGCLVMHVDRGGCL